MYQDTDCYGVLLSTARVWYTTGQGTGVICSTVIILILHPVLIAGHSTALDLKQSQTHKTKRQDTRVISEL